MIRIETQFYDHENVHITPYVFSLVKNAKGVLNDLDLHQFIEYAQSAGLSPILRGEVEGNYTIFVPSRDAFKGKKYNIWRSFEALSFSCIQFSFIITSSHIFNALSPDACCPPEYQNFVFGHFFPLF